MITPLAFAVDKASGLLHSLIIETEQKQMTKAWPKTKAGAERQISALINAYRKNWAGGGSFGFDWPTMRLNDPETYDRIRALQTLAIDLPFKDGTRLPR